MKRLSTALSSALITLVLIGCSGSNSPNNNPPPLEVNDQPPVMTSPSVAAVLENTQVVLTLSATDPDDIPGQPQIFNLAGIDANLFDVNGNSLLFKDAPDYEQRICGGDNLCIITITPFDGVNRGLAQTISITIMDATEAVPVTPQPAYAGVPEHSTHVLSITVTDEDDINTQDLAFTIAGSDARLFTIERNVLSFRIAPDFEDPRCRAVASNPNQCKIEITPSDGVNTGAPQQVTVSVINLNDIQPFMSSTDTVTLAENIGTVLTLTVTDADNLADQTHSFSLSGLNADLFSVDGSTLSFVSAPNYERFICGGDNLCDLSVTPFDGINRGDTQAIQVRVTNSNDIAPVMTSRSTMLINENSTAVLTLTASDADNLAGQTQGFALSGEHASLFTIDNGNQLRFIEAPDFEAEVCSANRCNIAITPTDGTNIGLPQAVSVFIRNIDDIAPIMSSTTAVTINENSTAVLNLRATDADQLLGQTQSFHLSAGDTALFAIDGRQLRFIDAPDYENDSCGIDHQCVVSVFPSDGTNVGLAQTITINVANVNDIAPIMSSANSASVPENSRPVLTLTASDADNIVGQTQGFSLGGSDVALFRINGNRLSFRAAPDFENPACGGTNQCQVTITPDDGINTGVVQTIIIDITNLEDIAPVMSSATTATVLENSTATLLLLTATDSDEASTTAVISYSIIGVDANLFMVDGSSLNFLVAPDFETPQCGSSNDQNVCQIAIVPTDRFFNSGIPQTITITIDNLNDNTPVLAITDTYTIPEDLIRLIEVGTITDADDPDGTGDYPFILAGVDAALFQITTTSSMPAINNSGGFDYENPTCGGGTSNSCQVTITPFDGTNYGITQNFTVIVNNDNDNAPVMSSSSTITVLENTITALELTATDGDGQIQGFDFSLSGSDALTFMVDNDQLNFITAPDFESPICGGDNQCQISITPSDGTNIGAPQAVTVTIDDIEAMVIASDTTVMEGDAGTTIHFVMLTLDTAGTGSVDFTISDGSATADSDYSATATTTQTANFTGGGAVSIPIDIIGDRLAEGDETLLITLTNANNIDLASPTIEVIIINDELLQLNDTGVEIGADYPTGNNMDCSSNATLAQQDCSQGRDAAATTSTFTKVGAGIAGFDFTKLAADGSDLAIQTATYSVTGTEAAGTIWSCVRDNHTELVWQVHTDYATPDVYDKDNTYRWGGLTAIGRDDPSRRGTYRDEWNNLVLTANDATNAGANGLCGFTDWRVPTITIFPTITYQGSASLSIDSNFFPNTVANNYWASTPSSEAGNSASQWAWRLSMAGGFLTDSFATRSTRYRVRLVRGGDQITDNRPNSRYTINADNTVTDTRTRLMWQRCAQGQDQASQNCQGSLSFHNWQAALALADTDSTAGYTDWRLPNNKELLSIVAYDRNCAAINGSIFPAASCSNYWTSTPDVDTNARSRLVDFSNGANPRANRTESYFVRLVRDAPR